MISNIPPKHLPMREFNNELLRVRCCEWLILTCSIFVVNESVCVCVFEYINPGPFILNFSGKWPASTKYIESGNSKCNRPKSTSSHNNISLNAVK